MPETIGSSNTCPLRLSIRTATTLAYGSISLQQGRGNGQLEGTVRMPGDIVTCPCGCTGLYVSPTSSGTRSAGRMVSGAGGL